MFPYVLEIYHNGKYGSLQGRLLQIITPAGSWICSSHSFASKEQNLIFSQWLSFHVFFLADNI